MARASYLGFFIISHLFFHSLAEEESSRCTFFHCGHLGSIGFPFANRTHPDCGLMIVDGCTEPIQKIQLGSDGPWYNIIDIAQDYSITIQDQMFQKYLDNRSCESFKNLTIPSSPLISFEIISSLTLFKCPHNLHNKPAHFNISCHESVFYYNHPINDVPSLSAPQCSLIQLPAVNETQNTTDLFKLLTGSFDLRVIVGLECQSDSKGNFQCSKAITEDGKLKLKLGLGLGTSGSGICIVIILAICLWKKNSSYNSVIFWEKKTENYRNIEDFLRKCGSLAPKRYGYADIKKMTNSFKHKIGQGGFGGVYKGKLLDGRNVAVKVLNESEDNGKDFINEVATISRTSHVNIVTLLGFCFEGRRRALIYEFVPNGSLEKFIYDKDSFTTNQKLNWETLYQIAVGTARGLEYLHRGCSTRILHFDIKPHNILLDDGFCPKISDFGLAKICPRRESIVSMTGTRGTIGYIAPELFCRNFGEVSHKSDVYSYGMMVFEMTGRKDNDVGINNSSDVYFPHWVYKRLETDEEFVLQGIENEDKEYARKMIIVSLWCIQTIPSNRPTMTRVVEMLEGKLDSLQIPPKPFLSSLGISQQTDSSTIESTLTL